MARTTVTALTIDDPDLAEEPTLAEDIGGRLRSARVSQGMTLRGVAQSIGVSASLISQVETGKTQPSVSTLYALVNHLGISLDDVLGMAPTRTDSSPVPYPGTQARSEPLQRAADNPVLEMENGVRWEKLAVGPHSPVDPLLVTYQPGASSSVEGKHMRHNGLEFAYLITGRLTLRLEFEEHHLEPGDSLCFDSLRPHLYVNEGTEPASGLWYVLGRLAQGEAPNPAAEERVSDMASGKTPLASAVDALWAMDRLR